MIVYIIIRQYVEMRAIRHLGAYGEDEGWHRAVHCRWRLNVGGVVVQNRSEFVFDLFSGLLSCA